MTNRVERSGLKVEAALAQFLEKDVLEPLGKNAREFWNGFASLLQEFVPRNRAFLAKRDSLQAQIDAWHMARTNKSSDTTEYQAILRDIGYLVPEPGHFTITTKNVDPEIATMAGPQLVVPVLIQRGMSVSASVAKRSISDGVKCTWLLTCCPSG